MSHKLDPVSDVLRVLENSAERRDLLFELVLAQSPDRCKEILARLAELGRQDVLISLPYSLFWLL